MKKEFPPEVRVVARIGQPHKCPYGVDSICLFHDHDDEFCLQCVQGIIDFYQEQIKRILKEIK